MIYTIVGTVGTMDELDGIQDEFEYVVNRKAKRIKASADEEFIKERQVNFIAGTLTERASKGSRYIRSDANLMNRTLIALDFDKINVDAETFKKAVHDALAEFSYYLYPTKRNTPENPRYRLILKPDKPFTRWEHKPLIREIESRIGFKTGDDANETWSQMNGLPVAIGISEEAFRQTTVENHGKPYPITVTPEIEPEKPQRIMDANAEPLDKGLTYKAIENYVSKEANRIYLNERSNFFDTLCVILKSVETGEIDIEDAKVFTEMLAGNNAEWAEGNMTEFERESRIPRKTQKTFMEKFDYYGEVRNLDAISNVIKMPTKQPVDGAEEAESNVKMAKAKKAKMLVMDNIEEFYYVSGTTYVKIPMNGHSELVRTDSKAFKNWLIFLYEAVENAMLPDGDVRTVIASIDSIAYFKGKREDIYLRIAEKDGKIIVDLCNEKRQVLEIDADGFRVLDDSPVLFRRTDDMGELPIPIFENNMDYMRLGDYLNYDKVEDLNMIVAFILATFRPNMPKPILNLTGEAGSGKSMNTKMIRRFIDPAKEKQLLVKEINQKEIPLAVTSQYLVAFDNLSGISKEGSDLLCTISTGGVMTTRRLYTNSEEEIVSLKKVVILNGIDDISKRQDLVSRSIFINTPTLREGDKKTESDILDAFEQDYPYIFGSIVNAVVCGLRNNGKDNSAYPRMMDFGRFIANSTPALEWDEGYWQGIYIENQESGVENSIESDPFASELVEMMEDYARDGIFTWEGTSAELLNRITLRLHPLDITRDNAFPKYNQIKARLRRIAPSIASRGIKWMERKSNGKQLISITIKP